MAVLDVLTYEATRERVSLLDSEEFTQVFSGLTIMDQGAGGESSLPTYTTEKGTDRTFAKVDKLRTMSITGVVGDEGPDVYQQLHAARIAGTLFVVQGQIESLSNMMIQAVNWNHRAGDGTQVGITVNLQEWREVTAEYGETVFTQSQVENGQQSSTVDRGQQQPNESSEATQERQSVLYEVFTF